MEAVAVTPQAIREALSQIGKTHGDLADELGVNRAVVQGVLYGHLKGVRGDAHKVAVALGLKNGTILDGATPITEAVRKAAA